MGESVVQEDPQRRGVVEAVALEAVQDPLGVLAFRRYLPATLAALAAICNEHVCSPAWGWDKPVGTGAPTIKAGAWQAQCNEICWGYTKSLRLSQRGR